MDQKKLPNATTSLVLGIISFVVCCTGIGSLILSGIALVMANKDKKLYLESPQEYSNYSQSKNARVIAIIGLIIGAIITLWFIYVAVFIGENWDEFYQEFMDAYNEAIEEAQ